MSSIIIAGSGTGVGKTFTTCALVAATGRKACKPIISGFSGADTDTHYLIEAMGGGEVEHISPWRFAAPLSPDMAAALENKTIDFEALVAWTRARDGHLIETVGGIMVPLTERHTTLDWLRAVDFPIILVTGSYLGALSHTLTACEVLRSAGLTLRGVVMNESAASPAPLADIKSSLQHHLSVPVVAQPRVNTYRDATEIQHIAASWI